MDENDNIKIFIVVCLFILFFFAGVNVGQAHDYPTNWKSAEIIMKMQRQKAAIDKQFKDQEIELKKLELEIMRQKEKCEELTPKQEIELISFDFVEHYLDDEKITLAIPSKYRLKQNEE